MQCDIVLGALLSVYSIARLSQLQLMYRARLALSEFAAGAGGLEVRLFAWEDIPWTELAFPSVCWTLNHYRETKDRDIFASCSNPE